ncbi:MAG: hypothetical protein ACK4RW_00700 [Rehaibacterium terrae]|uniref:DNA polymerase Y family protein n=1 Tax=Rehaibacterium terrae TaxID=1341696 RepID=UPI00391B6A23
MTLRSLFVDFNSYFASVEQQDDPALRGRPVGVVPVLAESTCCIAASIEAKRHGVKTGTLVREARRLCPDIAIVPARPARYVHYHHALLAAIERCIPIHKVGSIDEVACTLLGSQRRRERAVALAREIKASVAEVGEWLRCSIGIAPNAFLAKTASDMQKPDGLVVLEAVDLPQALYRLALNDLCGIGPAMEARLRAAGITTVERLCAAPRHELRRIWGGIEGERFHARLHGEEVEDAPTRRGSIGHSHVLPPELRGTAGANAVLKKLLQKAAMRLRGENLLAGALQVKVKYVGADPWEAAVEFDHCDDTRALLHRLGELIARRRDRRPVLAVGVTLLRLIERSQSSGSLFGQQDEAEARALNAVIDRINEKYGLNKIYFGGAQDALTAAPMRIPFNRIPDATHEQEAEKNELWLERIRQARVLAEAEHRRVEGLRRKPTRAP